MQPAQSEPRAVCWRCRRPQTVCYCQALPQLPTQTRVVLLQHFRERDKAIGTARMASLCLPNSKLFVGNDFDGDRQVREALSNPEAPAVLLYPGKDAKDILREPPAGPCTLVVVDGTWAQAKTVVRDNPELAKLPRYAFQAPAKSEYRIRQEPSDEVVSTIEALMYVLGVLEKNPEAFAQMMTPFRAMVEAQLACEKVNPTPRVRHPRNHVLSPTFQLIKQRWADLVCIGGEANSFRHMQDDTLRRHELVHWAAMRPATGESFSKIAAPRGLLSPTAAHHIRLSEEQLQAGGSLDELIAAFSAFLRPTDILCSWGRYSPELYVQSGGELSADRLDLKTIIASRTKETIGPVEAYTAKILPNGISAYAQEVEGRAGARVTAMSDIFNVLYQDLMLDAPRQPLRNGPKKVRNKRMVS